MISKSLLSKWAMLCRGLVRVPKTEQTALAAIKNELQFNEFQVDQFRVDGFMHDPHPHMFDFDNISLKRIVKPVFKVDEVRDLAINFRSW